MNGTDNEGRDADWKTGLREADAGALERMTACVSQLRANLSREQSDRLARVLKDLDGGMTRVCRMTNRLCRFNLYVSRHLFGSGPRPAGYLLCMDSLRATRDALDLYASAAQELRESLEAAAWTGREREMLARLELRLVKQLEALEKEEKALADRHEKVWSFTRPSNMQLLLASDDAGLAVALLEWCRRNDKALRPAELGSGALVAEPCFAAVVDRGYVGRAGWEQYCNYCAEVAEPIPEEERREFAEQFGDGIPLVEDTPIILVDQPLEESRATWPLGLPSKEDLVFWIDRSNANEILKTLDRIVEGRRSGAKEPLAAILERIQRHTPPRRD